MASMSLPLLLPTGQNWSCHSCSRCCRDHVIPVTAAERQRIMALAWTAADDVPAGAKAFRRLGGSAAGSYRLEHAADGACVFLDKDNRCRIHSRFGADAKPLACRVYPFTFQPAGGKVNVGLRFSCPSAAGNQGATLAQQQGDLLALRDLVVHEASESPPPPISPAQQLDWPDTLRIVRGLRQVVVGNEGSLATRLVHALFIADMLGKATFEKVRGGRIDELIDALATAAPLETVADSAQLPEPQPLALTQFRLIVAQYAVRDTVVTRGLGYRLGKVLAGLRFARGRGQTPAMQESLGSVPFVELESPFDGDRDEIDDVLGRFYDVKLTSLAFCGASFHGLSVIEGFQRLVLLHPVVLYIARWIARGEGRTMIEPRDAQRALSIVDHHHGYSRLMGRSNFRYRANWLVRHGELAKVVGWYGR